MNKAEREEKARKRLEELQDYERQLHQKGILYIAGVDEAGRGPLAGPVVAAAVVLPEEAELPGVDDSKKLSEKKREQLYEEILEKAVCYGIGQRDSRVIDEINILEATREAMAEAVEKADAMCFARTGEPVGYVLFDAMQIKTVAKPQESLIKGDSRVLAIAAASIIAKVTRDRQMRLYDQQYPGYGFAANKGYGTKAHYEGLRKSGLTPIHRRTFLKNILHDD